MEIQKTILAAAVSLAFTSAALADGDRTSNVNLEYKEPQGSGWGVDKKGNGLDNAAWDTARDIRDTELSEDSDFDGMQSDLDDLSSKEVNAEGNHSSIIQEVEGGSDTTGNWASVVQLGERNKSEIVQTKEGTGNALEAAVVQDGKENYSDINQKLSHSGIANVEQFGNKNRSRINQLGSENNFANVSQNGIRQASIVDQGTDSAANGASNNSAWVTQAGSGENSSYIMQRWHDNKAIVSQGGLGGTSHIKQLGNLNEAYLTDTGDYNVSYINQGNQENGAAENWAKVTQSGLENRSYASQNGSLNEANISQAGTDNRSDLYQLGNGNYAEVTQKGDNGTSELYQRGGSEAYITQHDRSDYALSEVYQDGAGNKVTVDQYGLGTASEFNESHILQYGNSNTATVSQSYAGAGWNNVSTITQIGNTNTAEVSQTGSGNRASTIQYQY